MHDNFLNYVDITAESINILDGVDRVWTISALQRHPDGIVACDERKEYFKEIYKNEK